MVDGFDLNIGEIKLSFSGIEMNLGNEPTRYVKPIYRPEIKPRYVRYDHAADLAKIIDPENGLRLFAMVSGNFIFGDLIEALLTRWDAKARRVVISTLSLSQDNVDSLHNLMTHGYVETLDLIVSDYFFSHERQNLVPYIYANLDLDDRFQLAVAGSHCKVCLIDLGDAGRFVIHGSANLRSSGCAEQIVIEECSEAFDFFAEPFEAILAKYQTIKKAVRREELWQAVQAGNQKANV